MRKNGIGMFNVYKGIGMLIIIMIHSIGIFAVEWTAIKVLGIALMPSFFMISGYGFRKVSNKKCLQQQLRSMLIPYAITALATTIVHLISHYSAFHYFPASVKETFKMALSFILALPSSGRFFGMDLFTCGPCWYIFTLFLGWILLNFLMNVVKEKYMWITVIILSFIGLMIGLKGVIPFCISQALISLFFIYFGYTLKQKRFFDKEKLPVRSILFFILCIAIVLGALIIMGESDGMADGHWNLGYVGIVIDAFLALYVVFYALKLNRFDNKITDFLSFLGRNSLYIFCVHTVEMMGIPWYLMAEAFVEKPYLGFVLEYILRVVLIIVTTIIVINRKVIIEKIAGILKKNSNQEN